MSVMPKPFGRYLAYALAIAIGAVGIFWVLRPQPVEVEVALTGRGPLTVTLDEQAETRSHDRFVVAAPVAGRVQRLELHEGDAVAAGQIIAQLEPAPLGEREQRELEARLSAARALLSEAQERQAHSEADLAFAQRELTRIEALANRGLVARQTLDQARNAQNAAEHEANAAHHRVRAASADVAAVNAGLIATRADSSRQRPVLTIRAPVAGRILRLPEKSDRFVASGTTLVVIGDLTRLEVLIEMLSTEAVKVKVGMPVLIDGGGDDRVLRARVATVEPYAFTKVSALGVEEKRSNVIAEFIDPPAPLGDGYRVSAHVVIFAASDVLRGPAAGLYQCGNRWCVFVVEHGRARQRTVAVGHRNSDQFEITGALTRGAAVIVYPPNDLKDDDRVSIATPNRR
jgi:HlyD family secretion protein